MSEKLPTANIDEERLRGQLIQRILDCEMALLRHKIDNFHVGRRTRNSRAKHLGTQYLSCAYTEDLVEYYRHLAGKLKEAGLLKEEENG